MFLIILYIMFLIKQQINIYFSLLLMEEIM